MELTTNRSDQRLYSKLSYFFSETYCGGYSGEDPPLPIPNREVKLTSADGTAPPGGRVGSCHFLIQEPWYHMMSGFFCYISAENLECARKSNLKIWLCSTIFCFRSHSEGREFPFWFWRSECSLEFFSLSMEWKRWWILNNCHLASQVFWALVAIWHWCWRYSVNSAVLYFW